MKERKIRKRNGKPPTPEAIDAGLKLKELRESRNLSQTDLAELVGTTQPTISNYEFGGTENWVQLLEICMVLGVQPGYFWQHLKGLELNVQQQPKIIKNEMFGAGQSKLPVYSTTWGDQKGTLLMSVEPVDYAERPSPLANVKQGYGVEVSDSSCMEPLFEAGDLVYVSPQKALVLNCDVLLRCGARNSEQKSRIMIGRYVGQNETHWTILQYRPPHEHSLAKTEWTECHKIIGKFSGR